ncbi:rhomboid family intramembrane serine protease [Paenibacillus nanensis]|uniref:Rhomboid family intramembrane serine protease n=1 Tax=Paenibacillus nanensis TaxID=393251 RepID=A0A3A1USD4_9BACL|nr:rhomboid family intramembrane serine protease [Paenibacillus nanensis]RIX50321.1 rhomboid family intramembrane serine protease [Paenibacillus nanensis]
MFSRKESLAQYIRLFPVVSVILVINILLFIAMELYGSSSDVLTLLRFGAMTNFPDKPELWHYVSAVFLHIGFMHLLMNGAALYVFGASLERILGKWRFIALYLVSGVAGNLVSVNAHQEPYIGAGASGAIYGVYAAYVYFSIFHKTAFGVHNARTIQTIVVIGVIHSLIVPNVDLSAHIGGFFGGFIMTTLFSLFNRRE